MNQYAVKVFETLKSKEKILVTAESCTGGMIAASMTDMPGSSCVFDRGFVTYSYESKAELLGVDLKQMQEHGAVSASIAEQMAKGALSHSNADITVAVTGIAGPDGGLPDKPVGTVWFAIAKDGYIHSEKQIFDGDRANVRAQTRDHALSLVLEHLEK